MSTSTRIIVRRRNVSGSARAEECRGVDLAGLLGEQGITSLKKVAEKDPLWTVAQEGGRIRMTCELSGTETGGSGARGTIQLEGQVGMAGLTVRDELEYRVELSVRESENATVALADAARGRAHRVHEAAFPVVNKKVNALLAKALKQELEQRLSTDLRALPVQHVNVENTREIVRHCGVGQPL